MTLRQFCAEGGIASAVSYAADHPHAVAAFGSNTMTYDKNGNMTYASGPDVASSYAFDPENRMAISRSGAFIKTYLYDGMGELVRRSRWHVWYAPGTNDMRDTFVDGIYEEQNGPTTPFVSTTQTSCSPPATITKYYTAFGRVIATRVNGVLSYNLADHLGSTVQQIDSMNTPGPAIKYFPFGAPRNGTTSPERAFTGQQREDDSPLGMYYYHARFYSSVLGHFMSTDSIAPTADNRGLNRYAYTYGNPLRFTDPTGHCAWEDSNCSPGDMLNFIKCGFGDGCGNEHSSDLERHNLFILSQWIFRQKAFFDRVSLFAQASESFHDAVVSHRFTFSDRLTQDDIYFYEDSGGFSRGPAGDPGGMAQGPGIPDLKSLHLVGTLRTVAIDYSYLDIRVLAGGGGSLADGGGLDFRVYTSVDENGWQGHGVEGRFRIDFSLFDPAHYALQVKFDIVSVSNLGRPVLFDRQGSTFSRTYDIPLLRTPEVFP